MSENIKGINRQDLFLQSGVRKVIIVDENGNPVTPGPGPGGNVVPAEWDYKLLDVLRLYFEAERQEINLTLPNINPILKWMYITHPEFRTYAVVSLLTTERTAIYLLASSGVMSIDTVNRKVTSTAKFYSLDITKYDTNGPWVMLERDRGTSVDWSSQPGPLKILTQYDRGDNVSILSPANVPPMFVPKFDPAKDALIFADRRLLYRDPSRVDQYMVWTIQNAANVKLYWTSSNAYTAKYGVPYTDMTDYKALIIHNMTEGTLIPSSTYTTEGFKSAFASGTYYLFGFPIAIQQGMDNDINGIVFSTLPLIDLDGNVLRKADTNGKFIKTR